MVKNISAVLLAGFMLAGTAQAALIYNDESSRFTTDVKAEMYVGHDFYGYDRDSIDGRTTGIAEMTGKITMENFYTRNISDEFSGRAFLKLEFPAFSYSEGAYGDSNARDLNTHLSTFSFINRAYLELDHRYAGTLTIGRFKSFYSHLGDFSDVDVFVGTPAHNVQPGFGFVTGTNTGIAYTNNIALSGAILGISLDAPKFTETYSVLGNIEDGHQVHYQLQPDFRLSGMVQYNFSTDIRLGAAYSFVGYRVAHDSRERDTLVGSNSSHYFGHAAILGATYEVGATLIGVTGSYQLYDYNYGEYYRNRNQILGIEAGISYDFSRVQRGLRPSIQYDFQISREHRGPQAQHQRSHRDSYGNHVINAHSVELALAYYVNPNLHYVAAAVVDIRSNHQINEADGVPSGNAVPHHYFGLGVVFNF